MNRKIDKGTVVRLIMLVCTFATDIIAICTGTNFGNNPIFACICAILTVVSVAVSYWYNNDWTSIALLCRDVFDMLEDGKIDPQEVEDLIKKHKEDKSNG